MSPAAVAHDHYLNKFEVYRRTRHFNAKLQRAACFGQTEPSTGTTSTKLKNHKKVCKMQFLH